MKAGISCFPGISVSCFPVAVTVWGLTENVFSFCAAVGKEQGLVEGAWLRNAELSYSSCCLLGLLLPRLVLGWQNAVKELELSKVPEQEHLNLPGFISGFTGFHLGFGALYDDVSCQRLLWQRIRVMQKQRRIQQKGFQGCCQLKWDGVLGSGCCEELEW